MTVGNYINESSTASTTNKVIDFTHSMLDGYTPKNNKLLTYPFNYLLVSNNSGTDVIYRFEDFYTITNNEKQNVTPRFKIESTMTPRWFYSYDTKKLQRCY